MQRGKGTKITIYQDSPVAVSSTVFGANVNAVVFNADYIGEVDADLVKEIFRLYEKCKKLRSK